MITVNRQSTTVKFNSQSRESKENAKTSSIHRAKAIASLLGWYNKYCRDENQYLGKANGKYVNLDRYNELVNEFENVVAKMEAEIELNIWINNDY